MFFVLHKEKINGAQKRNLLMYHSLVFVRLKQYIVFNAFLRLASLKSIRSGKCMAPSFSGFEIPHSNTKIIVKNADSLSVHA